MCVGAWGQVCMERNIGRRHTLDPSSEIFLFACIFRRLRFDASGRYHARPVFRDILICLHSSAVDPMSRNLPSTMKLLFFLLSAIALAITATALPFVPVSFVSDSPALNSAPQNTQNMTWAGIVGDVALVASFIFVLHSLACVAWKYVCAVTSRTFHCLR
jgi:hypothetical protein